jgi:hypothetical protein
MNGRAPSSRQAHPDGSTSRDQLKANLGLIGIIVLISVGIAVTIGFLHFADHVSVYRLISDPAPFVGMPWYFGSLSNAGVLLWTASAAVCLFVARLLWQSADRGRRRLSRLLTILGAGSLWFALDDLLLVHEQLGRLMFDEESRHTGEALVFGVYALFMLGCFVWYRDTVAQTAVVLLYAALFFLGVSVAIDTILQLDMGGNNYVLEIVLSRSWGGPTIDIVEDILKLCGSMLMLAYFFETGYIAIRQETTPKPAISAEPLEVETRPRRKRKAAHR